MDKMERGENTFTKLHLHCAQRYLGHSFHGFTNRRLGNPHWGQNEEDSHGLLASRFQRSLGTLSQYKGNVVLLDFWATWCHGCRTEIPWYMEFENKYKDKGLAVIGVSMDTGWNTVKPFMAKEKMNYPVVLGSDGLMEHYGSHSMPATYLIDREGRIADYHIGVVNKDQFESEIKKLLAGKAG